VRVASIDIGTNSVLLTVAETSSKGGLKPVWNGISEPRLGEGVDASGKISDGPLDRTAKAVVFFAAKARAMGVETIIAFGTQALRTASNGIEAADKLSCAVGTKVELLDPEEEARFAFIGATSDMSHNKPTTVVDIGGGSTEIAWGVSEPTGFVSLPIGALVLTESCGALPPISDRALRALRDRIDSVVRAIPSAASGNRIVGVGGTITTLAALYMGLEEYSSERIHGVTVSAEWIRSAMKGFEEMGIEDITARIPFAGKRAKILPSGTAIAYAILEHLHASDIIVSDHGARWGIIVSKFDLC